MTDHVHKYRVRFGVMKCIHPSCDKQLWDQEAEDMLNAAEQLLPILHNMNRPENYYATFALFGDSVPDWIYNLAKERGGE